MLLEGQGDGGQAPHDTAAGLTPQSRAAVRPYDPSPEQGEPGEDTIPVRLYRNGHGAGPPRSGDGDGVIVHVPREIARGQLGYEPEPGPDAPYLSYVVGESMEPWLPDGSPVWIEPGRDVRDGGRYAFSLDGDGEIIRRVERLSRRRWRLKPDNGAFSSALFVHTGEGDEWRDETNGGTVTLLVRGRVVYPRDTARAILEEVIAATGRVLYQVPER